MALAYGNLTTAKALVIGHDPLLQASSAKADYAFFADLYYKPIPKGGHELRQYGLAKKMYDYIAWLSSDRYQPQDLYVTNLCNVHLKRTAQNMKKTVYIPKKHAEDGTEELKMIIGKGSFETVFAMSPQVNYWLQELGFCESREDFLLSAKPKKCDADLGFYTPSGKPPFLKICGCRLMAQGVPLFPILHVKQYPLTKRMKPHYGPLLENVRKALAECAYGKRSEF